MPCQYKILELAPAHAHAHAHALALPLLLARANALPGASAFRAERLEDQAGRVARASTRLYQR